MNEEKRKEVWKWLVKSQHDLGSAHKLLAGKKPYLDTGVYHCQQAAEKALKAFLTYHDIAFGKTHDLTELVAQATQAETSFSEWQNVASDLTPYAVWFRYPADIMEPPKSEAMHAFRQATSLVNFILRLLPDEVQP